MNHKKAMSFALWLDFMNPNMTVTGKKEKKIGSWLLQLLAKINCPICHIIVHQRF
jgi:hypothetical protein